MLKQKYKQAPHNGRKKNPAYANYMEMKRRCYNKNSNMFYRYGGRGIKICDRWCGTDGFANFLSDMGQRPSIKHSVERIDNNKDYMPENCKWATVNEQAMNKSSNNAIVGVHFDKNRKVWQAYITISGKRLFKRFVEHSDAVKWRKIHEEGVI